MVKIVKFQAFINQCFYGIFDPFVVENFRQIQNVQNLRIRGWVGGLKSFGQLSQIYWVFYGFPKITFLLNAKRMNQVRRPMAGITAIIPITYTVVPVMSSITLETSMRRCQWCSSPPCFPCQACFLSCLRHWASLSFHWYRQLSHHPPPRLPQGCTSRIWASQ